MLVKLGADINSSTDNGATPLLLAAQFGHYELVSYLLEKNVLIMSKCEVCPDFLREMAQKKGKENATGRVEKFIEQQPVGLEGNLRILPHEIAFIMGHDKVAELIEKKMSLSSSNMNCLFSAKKAVTDQFEPDGLHSDQPIRIGSLNEP